MATRDYKPSGKLAYYHNLIEDRHFIYDTPAGLTIEVNAGRYIKPGPWLILRYGLMIEHARQLLGQHAVIA